MSGPRKPLKKISMRLFEEDVDDFSRFYPHRGQFNSILREVVHHHMNKLREISNQMEHSDDALGDIDFDINKLSPDAQARLRASSTDLGPEPGSGGDL